MMRKTTIDILEKTKAHLNKISTELTKELTTVINGHWGLTESNEINRVFLLDIEIFTDGYRLVLYPMDKKLTQLGYKRLLEEYPGGLLSGKEFNPDISTFDLDNEQDIKELDEFDSARKKLFVTWFTDCWNNSDKKKLMKPMYLMFHDASTSLDLNENRWIKDEIKWS